MAKIKLNNVRLSFPSLFHKASFQGSEGKYEATFLLSKEEHKDVIAKIEAEFHLTRFALKTAMRLITMVTLVV